MKYSFFLFAMWLCLSANTVFAQVKVFEVTDKSDIGFGKSSKCSEHLSFVVNGPLVGSDGMPVGGYSNDGNQIKDWVAPEVGGGNYGNNNGIFGLGTDGQMHLIPYEQWNNGVSFSWAIQNGPILVYNGENARVGSSKTSKYIRSGIGFRPDGSVVVIISLSSLNLSDFAQLFLDNGCSNAIYLDGGPYCGYSDISGEYGSLQPGALKLQFFHQ